VTARAIYATPADALSSGSISDFAENGFVKIGETSGLMRGHPARK
jgi:hypothetical protein